MVDSALGVKPFALIEVLLCTIILSGHVGTRWISFVLHFYTVDFNYVSSLTLFSVKDAILA